MIAVFEFLMQDFFVFVWRTAIFWLPLLVLLVFRKLWLEYIQKKHISKLKWAMLHIKLPQEIRRSPQAMELIFNHFHQFGPNWTGWVKGNVTPWFSLEIASIEGNIYFFIRTLKQYIDILKPAIYAHFPDVEVSVVDDYTKHVERWRPEGKWDMWSAEYKLKKADVYPIKTYVDYGLDKQMKEDEKIDPMATVLEHMGSMGPGEQMWLQILVTKPMKRFNYKFYTRDDWKEDAKKEIQKMKDKFSKEVDGKKVFSQIMMTKAEKQVFEALEKSIDQTAFDVGMRAVYYYKKDKFRLSSLMGAMGMVKSFNSDTLNNFATTNTTFFPPGKDILGIRLKKRKKLMFEAYLDRGYFYVPYYRKPFILTAEELATIFHFPSASISTPGIDRVQSKKASPPVNLPIG